MESPNKEPTMEEMERIMSRYNISQKPKEDLEPLDPSKLIWGFNVIESYEILINRINWLTKKVQELEKKGGKSNVRNP